jgi:hypothetical protein
MTQSRLTRVSLLCVLILSGCHWHGRGDDDKAKPAVAVTGEARARLQRLAPHSVIGRVVAVVPESRLAAVGDVQVQDFKPGDIVTFMGGEETPLADGEIVAIVKDTLHVKYTQGPHSPRAPAVGDLAFRFTN